LLWVLLRPRAQRLLPASLMADPNQRLMLRFWLQWSIESRFRLAFSIVLSSLRGAHG
jgi:hypothetical protein